MMHIQNQKWNQFDVIVVGAGHAGNEAAYAAARMGSRTLLLTLNIDRIGHMPCNPAIGGIGKGHIVFEISALGGLMPQVCTQSYLQARMLNTRKGPAVQGLRLQIDKIVYNDTCKRMLHATPNLTILMGLVEQVLCSDGVVSGVTTREGATYYAPTVIITTGTFLNGLVHTGQVNHQAGRQGEEASTALSASLKGLGLRMGRLKTGTPPRLRRSSLDFSKMEPQGSDALEYLFEFYPHKVEHKIDCYITYTNQKTHDVLRQNFHLSPIFTGTITGTPPRYCPSIEDKISRFADKSAHHIFVEPESALSDEIYPNGLSTSMPLDVQRQFIQTIAGFENAIIVRPGYAVEYDYVFPQQLSHSLEVSQIPGLFLAGQINGTTGYEEAAGQGIIAGINAHLKHTGQEPFILHRHESYLGIMIDDLVTLGADEPYRMFTSRAERRLILRQDNVFERLGEKAHKLGLMSDQMYQDCQLEQERIKEILVQFAPTKIMTAVMQLVYAGDIEAVYTQIRAAGGAAISDRVVNSVYAELLYGPYLSREIREVEKTTQYQKLHIPATIDYLNMQGLSIELRQKLTKHAPATIAQAGLIQGMTPAAISLLIFKSRELLDQEQRCMKENEACGQ
jgi:glucose-inhibited division protein A